jgi:cell wall-associated NlpC family hydrolase
MTHVRKSVGLLSILVLAAAGGACAAKAGVPRPFPGAALPPSGAEPPVTRVEPPPVRAELPPPPAATPPSVPPQPSVPAPTTDLVQTALGYQGVPYVYGGSDPSGFDCSGFVQYVFAQFGTPLPREVRDQYNVGRRVALNEVRPGDLLFFETVTRGASHVGIAIGDGRFVHAPNSSGVVRVEPYTAIYWSRRLIGVRRLIDTRAPGTLATGLPGSVRSSR